jgi:hypothetical protein
MWEGEQRRKNSAVPVVTIGLVSDEICGIFRGLMPSDPRRWALLV